MLRLDTPRRMGRLPGELNHYSYQPRGVAAVIAPWNFPLAILTGMTSAALVAGNTVVVKPAGPTPVIGAQLARILRAAGAPPGVVNLLPGPGGEIGEALVGHPEVHLIAFTGSRAVGLRIHGACRRAPRPRLDQARDRRAGRQERDHRRRRRRPRRGRARDGRLGLRLSGAEVLGLLAGDRARSRPTTSSSSAWSRRRAASRSARPTIPRPGSAR